MNGIGLKKNESVDRLSHGQGKKIKKWSKGVTENITV